MTKLKLGAEVYIINYDKLVKEQSNVKPKDAIVKAYVVRIDNVSTSLAEFCGEVDNKILKLAKKGKETVNHTSIIVITDNKEMEKFDEGDLFLTVEDAKKSIVKDCKTKIDNLQKVIKNFK